VASDPATKPGSPKLAMIQILKGLRVQAQEKERAL
jgi:hypothetical protein